MAVERGAPIESDRAISRLRLTFVWPRVRALQQRAVNRGRTLWPISMNKETIVVPESARRINTVNLRGESYRE